MFDRVVGAALVLAAAALYFWVLPAQIEVPRIVVGGGAGGAAASPLFFPRFIAVLLAVMGTIVFLRGKSREHTLADAEGFTIDAGQAMRVGGTAAILATYLAALDTVGYLPLTPPVIVALAALCGYRRWLVTVPVALGVTLLVYYGFRYGMKVLLPEGLLD